MGIASVRAVWPADQDAVVAGCHPKFTIMAADYGRDAFRRYRR